MQFHRMSPEMIQLFVYQLDDIQSLIPPSSDFSKIKFQQMLLDMKKSHSFGHAIHKASIERPLTSIKQFKSLATSMKNGRRRNLTNNDMNVLTQHLNQLECLLNLKSYFDDRIFAFILKITSQWQITKEKLQKSKMADRNRKCFQDDFQKVNCCSPTDDDIKEMIICLNQIQAVELRWANMIDCSELNLAFFEKSTKKEILTQKERSPFELICYVLPDLAKKIEKCVKFSRKWLEFVSSEHNNQHVFPGTDSREKIQDMWMKIIEIEETILKDEQKLRRLQKELKRLAYKEVRYVMLKDDYMMTADKLEKVRNDYSNALLERHSLNLKIQKVPNFSEETEVITKLSNVGDRIKASHNDMKMLKYSFALLQEDMTLEASMRSSYIRFEENVKEMMSELQLQIEEKKKEKRRLDKELILLKANSKWFESEYGNERTEDAIDEDDKIKNEKYSFGRVKNTGVEGEHGVMSFNQKVARIDKNGGVSRIPILIQNANLHKTPQSTHAQLELKHRNTQNQKHKTEINDKQKTRIPKLMI